MKLLTCVLALLLNLCPLVSAWQAEWKRLDPPQRISPRRSGHAAFGTLDKHYIFGGYVEDDSMKRNVVKDLWKWKGDSWQSVEQSGDIPGARLVSAAAAVNDKAFLFGGWDPQTEGTGGVILSDVYQLDLKSHSWTKIGDFPDGPTSRHVAVAFGEKVMIHNHRCVDFVYIFDPISQSIRKQPTTGPCPGSRGLHAAATVNDSTVVVYGGAAKDGVMSKEVFALDTNTWKWKLMAEFPDTARAGSCLCRLSDSCSLLYGGAESSEFGLKARGDVWIFDLDLNKWELVVAEDINGVPPPRNAASLVKIAENEFLLTGGWSPFKKTWDDCFVLHVKP
ncbi:hypothetical protein MPSEU_000135800 [Mayamaea pseudoterrestris]|nr:hypothetical protein MPSEU_000135800 [Mayamaea pseudoterrestris]